MVDIPATVTQIGDHAFFFCGSLAAANFSGNAPALDSGVFDECASLFTIYYTPGATGFASEWYGYPAEINPSHVVSFNDWDGSVLEQQKIGHGQPAITPPVPIRTGYIFTGWDKEFNEITADLEITAQYQISSYTITFDSDGGSAVASITQNFGTTVVTPAAPTRSGYTFNGWSPAVPTTMPASDLTITAQWTINQYTITFNSTGGSPIASIIQNYGSTVIAPANPTRPGYTFNGWSPVIPATMPVGGAALTAQWIGGFPLKHHFLGVFLQCNIRCHFEDQSDPRQLQPCSQGLNEKQYIRVFKDSSEVSGQHAGQYRYGDPADGRLYCQADFDCRRDR